MKLSELHRNNDEDVRAVKKAVQLILDASEYLGEVNEETIAVINTELLKIAHALIRYR